MVTIFRGSAVVVVVVVVVVAVGVVVVVSVVVELEQPTTLVIRTQAASSVANCFFIN